VGGLIASRLIPAYGWPSIFIVGGALPLVIALTLLVCLPESLAFLINRGKPAERIARTFKRVFPKAEVPEGASFVFAHERKAKADVRELFVGGRAAGTLLLWVAYFFAFMILVTNSSWVPTLLRPLGVPVESSAVALAMYNFGSLFGSGAAGLLVETFGPVFILSLSMLGGAVAFASIGWSAPSVTLVTISETAFGFLVGTASSGLLALAAIYYPSAIRSTGVGWATAVGRFGSFTGPLVVGALLSAHWSVHVIFTTLGASIVIGAVACMLIPSERAKS
jgi:AAHS family 4-hydroxybenzoate transporter-like MFS transporter